MLDPQRLRRDIEDTARLLARRGVRLDLKLFGDLERRRKQFQVRAQGLRRRRNELSDRIGRMKQQGEQPGPLLEQVSRLGRELQSAEEDLREVRAKLEELLGELPNLPDADVPDGSGEQQNQQVRNWGRPVERDFPMRDHVRLGEDLGLLDLEAGARLSGSRFSVLRGELAALHRALIQFMLDMHTREHDYEELSVPHMVHAECLYGTGQLPKFESDLFRIQDFDLYLVPTAEVPVTNLVRERILEAEELPLRFACWTPCYRSEAGSYGKDTRGLLRQHQFEKVELVQIVAPADSERALEELTGHAEQVLQRLELPYRVVNLCAGDLGFAAAKTYDLEAWLPGQQRYREVSSCSNCRDFQARRMQARWRDPRTGKVQPLHTLNGSGVAAGRALIALLENHQQADGRIRIPEPLHPYLGGLEWLGRPEQRLRKGTKPR